MIISHQKYLKVIKSTVKMNEVKTEVQYIITSQNYRIPEMKALLSKKLIKV